jgi:hypothetical protein
MYSWLGETTLDPGFSTKPSGMITELDPSQLNGRKLLIPTCCTPGRARSRASARSL